MKINMTYDHRLIYDTKSLSLQTINILIKAP